MAEKTRSGHDFKKEFPPCAVQTHRGNEKVIEIF